MIADGFFTAGDRSVFEPLLNSIFGQRDRFMVLADFADYVSCQERVARAYRDQTAWTQKSIINVARAGRFSSDRTALDYARDVRGLDVDGVEPSNQAGSTEVGPSPTIAATSL